MQHVPPTTRAGSPPRRRGRPRDDERDEAIIEATVALLSEHGVEHLRIQDVADRAGVGLATIYRRWPTKRDLLLAAVSSHAMPAVEPTGDVRADVSRLLDALAEELSAKRSHLFPSILAVMREDEGLAAAIRDRGFCQVRDGFAALLAQAPGVSADDARARADIAPALLMWRGLFLGEDPSPRLTAEIADLLLAGLPAGSRAAEAPAPDEAVRPTRRPRRS